jgi:DNA-binding response OmpR family regulator
VTHILVVEDEEQLAALIREHLVAAGYSVSVAGDGTTALQLLETRPADLVILDWMLPGLDGLEVCRRIRARSITPILMLTARAEEVDRVLGLEVGADDYLTKPFSMRELLARARALLRRVDLMTQHAGATAQDKESRGGEVLQVGELRVDVAGRTASVGATPLDLTPKEFDLLHMLAAQPGRAYSREFLLQRIWGLEYDGFDRTVDTHIVRLRKKLGSLGDRIATVWGVGYKLRGD